MRIGANFRKKSLPMSSPSNIENWIRSHLKAETLHAKSLIVTIFGDAIAPHGGTVWLKSIIDLLAPFGVSERLVRTSVFRLAAEGWLEGARHGRRSEYSLTTSGLRRFEHAHQRIYGAGTANAEWPGDWTLVLAPTSAMPPSKRGDLRRELLWEGFTSIGPGIFCHPCANGEFLNEILDRLGVRRQTFVLTARDRVDINARPVAGIVASGWDLESIARQYRSFIEYFGPLLKHITTAKKTAPAAKKRGASGGTTPSSSLSPRASFIIRTLVIHSFRRVLLHDPKLPAALLPENWPGFAAYDICRQIYDATHRTADEHLVAIMEAEAGYVPPLGPYFFLRFGGLHGET